MYTLILFCISFILGNENDQFLLELEAPEAATSTSPLSTPPLFFIFSLNSFFSQAWFFICSSVNLLKKSNIKCDMYIINQLKLKIRKIHAGLIIYNKNILVYVLNNQNQSRSFIFKIQCKSIPKYKHHSPYVMCIMYNKLCAL